MPSLLFALWLAMQADDAPPDDDDDDDDEGGGLPAPVPVQPQRPSGWPPRIRLALPRSLPQPGPVPLLASVRA